MWMIWTELVFDFLTICSDLSEDRCSAGFHDEQSSSIYTRGREHACAMIFGSSEAHSESDELYSRYPMVADGGLGLNCLDFSFLLIDKS